MKKIFLVMVLLSSFLPAQAWRFSDIGKLFLGSAWKKAVLAGGAIGTGYFFLLDKKHSVEKRIKEVLPDKLELVIRSWRAQPPIVNLTKKTIYLRIPFSVSAGEESIVPVEFTLESIFEDVATYMHGDSELTPEDAVEVVLMNTVDTQYKSKMMIVSRINSIFRDELRSIVADEFGAIFRREYEDRRSGMRLVEVALPLREESKDEMVMALCTFSVDAIIEGVLLTIKTDERLSIEAAVRKVVREKINARLNILDKKDGIIIPEGR